MTDNLPPEGEGQKPSGDVADGELFGSAELELGEGATDESSAATYPDDLWGDEEAGFDDGPSEEAPDIGAAPDARTGVEEWRIRSVGHRPTDFMARDCLFGSLFRDHRVPWFHRYVKRPSPWMEQLVGHLPNKFDRAQALRHVALHFLHKLHLARLLSYLDGPILDISDVELGFRATLHRLWNCTPYGVEVARAGKNSRPSPGCNLPRLCPWCHARKVVQLYQILLKGPLKRGDIYYLFFGKATPFEERMGGIDGSYRTADWYSYAQGGSHHGHHGRYFGRDADRLHHSRNVLIDCLMDQACFALGVGSGLWTHQLGSAQLESGQRTFLHDIAMIAEVDDAVIDRMPKDDDGKCFFGGRERSGLPDLDATLDVLWLPLPAKNPASLRVALAGSSTGYLVKKLNLLPDWFGAQSGIPGALSWQPTFAFDDQMWFAYALAVKNQPIYRAFGSWKDSIAAVARDARASVGRRFENAQGKRFQHTRQQKGNRQRGRETAERRAALLIVAQGLWSQVVSQPHAGKGRPSLRKRLEDLMTVKGHSPSRRDLDWLMKQLQS